MPVILPCLFLTNSCYPAPIIALSVPAYSHLPVALSQVLPVTFPIDLSYWYFYCLFLLVFLIDPNDNVEIYNNYNNTSRT